MGIIKMSNAEYEIDGNGVINQINPQPYVYDAAYSGIYDNPTYTRESEKLQAMRLAFATAALGKPINSILDYGYGNGAFIKFAIQSVPYVYGYDITEVPIPAGAVRSLGHRMPVDVFCFWDCLEHIHQLNILSEITAKRICVSLPNCTYHEKGDEWFESWHHRKPNEHVHHFNAESLAKTFEQYGWQMVAVSKHEDIVRKREGVDWNILTAAFRRI